MSRIIKDVVRAQMAGGSLRIRKFRSELAIATAYIVLYLLLDRVTFIAALHGIDVTPWNPPPGLSLALLLVKGVGYAPAVVVSALLSSQLLPLVRVPPLTGLMSALIIAAGYTAAAAMLRHVFRVDIRLRRMRDVALIIMVGPIAAGLVAFGFVMVYAVTGVILWGDAREIDVQLWIGDAIGTAVLTPFLLLVFDRLKHGPPFARGRRLWRGAIETTLQLASIVGVLVVVFGFNQDRYSFQLFYLLFLPVVWIATRRGLGGASWAVVAIQTGLIAALAFQDKSADTIRLFQLLMFTLASTGLLLGAVVSERHRVSRALAESQDRLAAILNTARDGVLTIDAGGRIESVNRAVERLFGMPARLLVGRNVGDLLGPGPALERVTSTARLPLSRSTGQELDARHANGSSFPIELTVGQFGDAGDEHYTLVIRDILARRQAEASSRAHQSELADVSRLSLAGEMASALAHELNQPLTAIAAYGRGCLRLMQQPAAEPQLMKEGVEQIIGQAERAGDIISRLREFMTTGMTRRSVMAVETLIEGAVALARTEAAQNGVEMQVRVAPDLPPVLADRIQIEQVLLNLLRNGMESILGSGVSRRVLTVDACLASREAVEIAVADSGPGVAEEMVAQLFEPFVTTKPLGMGLGLSISRSIVEAHDGQLRLIRREGAGAVFAFTLPAHRRVRELEASAHDK